MTLSDISEKLEPQIASIYIDSLVPHALRAFLKGFFGLVALASFTASLFSTETLFDGVALLCFSVFGLSLVFESFYNSSRFSEASHILALVMSKTEDTDLTAGFLSSMPGKVVMFRLGIPEDQLNNYIVSERTPIADSQVKLSPDSISFQSYAEAIYIADKSFMSFLSVHGVSEAEFLGTVGWIDYEFMHELKSERWWSRENLDAIPSIATGLDFGASYELSKYGAPVSYGEDMSLLDVDSGYRAKEISELENILVRKEEANAIIVDDDESVAKSIVLRLVKKMRMGTVPHHIEHKNIIKLDWNSLASDKKTKSDLEAEILKIFREADSAGNIIVYIPNLPSFMASAKSSGASISSLLEEFLRSKSLQIVAHSTKADFHYFIETNSSVLRMFERVVPEEEGVEASIPPVLEKSRSLEYKYKIYFSYPALLAIVESADRYITYGEMPSKALDLLIEIAPWARANKIKMLSKQDVASFVSQKTGIALGDPKGAESDKLAHLEEILHARIIGQDEAVKAVSSAMRRARSGITSHKRPFASFLFIGPTGVGKTETTKALAQSFFGGEEKIIRFDMSEYKEADALPSLIGSSALGKTGLLASKIRDNPYGVLLLDEFEKASPDVRDLFLALLDEGEFADALGQKVNCRNLIIIATSNAGSDMIWKMVESGEDLVANKDKIISGIVETRVMKPELVNRFDGVIVFHPLKNDELNKVATLMFSKLAERIRKEKQIEIKMSPSLLEYLVSNSTDQEFGARSINRLMQERIEDFLAKEILAHHAPAGSTIEITKENLG